MIGFVTFGCTKFRWREFGRPDGRGSSVNRFLIIPISSSCNRTPNHNAANLEITSPIHRHAKGIEACINRG